MLDRLRNVQSWADGSLLAHGLPEVVAFFANTSPLGVWANAIKVVIPRLRGVRPSEGFEFGGECYGCASEALCSVVNNLHRWLSSQLAFFPIAFVLQTRLLGKVKLDSPYWGLAVERYVEQELEGLKTVWKKVTEMDELYQALVDEPAFRQAVSGVNAPQEIEKLARECGQRTGELKLKDLGREVRWETSRLELTLPPDLAPDDTPHLAVGTPKTEARTPQQKGKPGRRGYSLEVLRHAKEIRRKHPDMKVHAIRLKCLEEYREDDMPADTESFRSWLNRRRKET
jgi:hypothetical protein